MKGKLFLIVFAFALMLVINCNGQPRNDYEVYSNPVAGADKYHFFIEKKSATPYKLTDGMDFLNPPVLDLKVGESTTPQFSVNLVNDGAEYAVGVVAENSAGYYSGMGVSVGSVGMVPNKPGGVGLRKK